MNIETLLVHWREWFIQNRRALFWGGSIVLLLWLVFQVKEVSSLLLLSYVLSLLFDPLVTRLEKRGLSRAAAIVLIGTGGFVLFLLFVVIIIPLLIREYEFFISALPAAIGSLGERINNLSVRFFHTPLPTNAEEILRSLRSGATEVEGDHLRELWVTVSAALLSGYSVTLTVFNLLFLPFFVFYISRDLRGIHRFVGRFIPDDIEVQIKAVGDEILRHVYAFFRGQITVSMIMAVLYAAGLWLVGFPAAGLVGLLVGVLNIVPYLGVGFGLVLATVTTLIAPDATLMQLLLVWGVFGIVQILEGTFLTPRIVGGSVGIHPLGAMLALVVGGQLFGLLGLIIAIPGAAALIVLFKTLQRAVEVREERTGA